MGGGASFLRALSGPTTGGVISRSSREAEAAFAPIRSLLSQQVLEALLTGGTTEAIPLVRQLVSATGSATDRARTNIDETLATAGLQETPLGKRITAESTVQGAGGMQQAQFGGVANFLQALPLLAGIYSAALSAGASPSGKSFSGSGSAHGPGGGGGTQANVSERPSPQPLGGSAHRGAPYF